MRVYSMPDAGKSFKLIEKFVKLHKCHRNILDQECAFVDTLLQKAKTLGGEVKKEFEIIKAEEAEDVKRAGGSTAGGDLL